MKALIELGLAGPLFALVLACGNGHDGSGSGSGSGADAGAGIGSATARTISDTETMKEAEAAANSVIRAVGDCDAVSAAYPAAIAKLDEVKSRVQTQAGRTSLEALRKQVTTAGEACGIR